MKPRLPVSLCLAAVLAGLHLPVQAAADSVLIINEVQYHPADEVAETEWIELRSLQGVDVDIGGWSISGGIDYTFPGGTTMPGGGYLVLAAVPSKLPGSVGPWTGSLNNGGETIRIVNRNGRVMDEVTYSDGGDWPLGPDGSGVTLARRFTSAASGPEQWSASRDVGGTPGLSNFQAAGSTNIRTRVVPVGATWKYLDTGAAEPAGWKTAGFDDAAWKSGPTIITGGGAVLNQVRPNQFPAGMLAYWNFDETTGATAANGVSGAPAGTMANGAAFVSDPVRGQVAEFDGVNDHMEIIDPATSLPSLLLLPAMTATNDFTWSCWAWSAVGATLTDQTGSIILGNRANPSGVDTTPREFIKLTPTAVQYSRNSSTTSLDYSDLPTTSWVHMCVVKRGLNLDYYKNGVFETTRTIPGALVNTQLPFFVGGDRRTTNSSAEHFQGRVDDVALWTRALTAAEVGQLGSGYGAVPAVMPAPAEQTTNAVAGPEPRYFRKTFSFLGAASRTTLELWPVADDGAVIYLNGTEVWRSNVPATAEVGQASFTPVAISIPSSALVKGANVLSAEVHQFSGSNDLLFGAELITDEQPTVTPDAAQGLILSEISGAADASPFIEVRNRSISALSTSGWSLKTDAGAVVPLPVQLIPAGGFASFTTASLGLVLADGMKLILFAPGGTDFRDARMVTNRARGLAADGSWQHPTTSTPGAANVLAVSDAIMINEIFYHGLGASPEQWVELYNKSASPVDVSGWKFSDGISYTFPALTPPVPAGGYVVVVWDKAAFAALHPAVAAGATFGPFSGSLSGGGELLRLRDENDNITDEITYNDGGRWSEWADGGGSSLELRDPHADNSKGESWDASDESTATGWQTVTYPGTGAPPVGTDPSTYHEFLFGLLNAGEMLIDDVSVKDVTQGNVELIQNGSFTGETTPSKWRVIGTHIGSIVDDPFSAGNKVLKVSATGGTEHMANNAGTTLKNGAAFHTTVSTDTYTISFRAKWLRGSERLHTRLYVNRLARQTLLALPATGGTPGAVNGRFLANAGPTFDALGHKPVVPAVSQAATVSVKVNDPDGIASVQLFTSVNGAAFTSTAMTAAGDGIYTGTVAGQPASALVQFYIRATDTPGAVAFFPATGPASRAMIPWQDGRAQLTLASGAKPHNIRVVMPAADATDMYKWENLMWDLARPCTVIFDESEVYYRAGVRLKSSEHGRLVDTRCGYTLEFAKDELLHGIHDTVGVDRSGGTSAGQKEILLKRLENSAGGIYASEDDIIRLIPALGSSPPGAFTAVNLLGPAIMSKTRLDGNFLDNQWDNGSSGPMFKYERIYVLTQTINPTTRVVDAAVVPENPKYPQTTTPPPGVGVVNLGPDKETYRWYWLTQNARDLDDYSGLMNVVDAVGQTGGSAAFNTLVDQYVNVDEWLRATIPAALYGTTDNYLGTGGGQHNTLFYFPPGQKAVLIPWDLDFLNQGTPTASLTAGGDLAKFIANPVWKRLFYGHLLDILDRTFNTPVMTTWATHYSRFGTDDMVGQIAAYLGPRATFARDVINGTGGQTAPIPPVVFSRTSASAVTVATPFTTVTGDGWINIDEIRLQGATEPLAVTWTDDNSWTLQLPVAAGTTTSTLVAYNKLGAQLGTITVTTTGSGGVFPAGAGSLAVSELNYNPPGNSDATEFIELVNLTGATLDLSGCHFDEENSQGISYLFPSGVQVAAHGRILVVRDRVAFAAGYPTAGPLAPGQFTGALDNSGETIVLYSASGLPIFRFTYDDSMGSTDGGGKSLIRILSSTAPDPNVYDWRPSTLAGGNPGATDALAFTGTPGADADGDGFSALVEYAFGTSDADATSQPPAPVFSVSVDGSLIITYATLKNADDVVTEVQTGTGLNDWVALAAQPSAADLRRFVRLLVRTR